MDFWNKFFVKKNYLLAIMMVHVVFSLVSTVWPGFSGHQVSEYLY